MGMEIGHTDDLNLHVDLNEFLRQRVYLDKTWVDGTVEATELCDETDVSLADWLVWIGAHHAARNSTATTDERAEGVDLCLVSGCD